MNMCGAVEAPGKFPGASNLFPLGGKALAKAEFELGFHLRSVE
jgi:hypothetical protein